MSIESQQRNLDNATAADRKADHLIACEALITYLANELGSNDSSNAVRCDIEGVEGAYLVKDIITEAYSSELESLVQQCVQTNPKNSFGGLHFTSEKKSAQNSMRRQSQLHTPLRVPQQSMRSLAKTLRPFLNPTASPFNNSQLEEEGEEISGYMRLYDYHKNEYSSPHFDKPFIQTVNGNVTRFSAYSILIYLNDACEGGETVFYPDASDRLHCNKARDESKSPQKPSQGGVKRTVAGNNLVNSSNGSPGADHEVESLGRMVMVPPKRGDILVFPHGRQAKCYADPYHSGGVVSKGRKTIIRTDVVYKISDATITKIMQKELAKREQQSLRLHMDGIEIEKQQVVEVEASEKGKSGHDVSAFSGEGDEGFPNDDESDHVVGGKEFPTA